MAIAFNAETKTFFLDGKNLTYAFRASECGALEHLYMGASIAHDDLSYTLTTGCSSKETTTPGHTEAETTFEARYSAHPLELSFFGTGYYDEPTVQVENAAGDRLCELLYDGYEILEEKPKIKGMPSMRDGRTLVVHLSDKTTRFAADLYYTAYDDASVIARRIVYKNGGESAVKLHRAYSFSLGLPHNEYEVLSLYGAWARERHIQKTPVMHGVINIDSKRASSSAVLNPFVGLLEKGATETSGNVYGFSLVYSGSFSLKVQGVKDHTAMVTGGINDFDFKWTLSSGESFETPEVVIAFSDEGLGGMSRAFHDAYRNHLINPRYVNKPRPVVINNWEGTYFDFNNDKLCAIAEGVKGTGVDTFVLDDGWFGKRDDDTSGLGDWFVNEKKMEGGLKKIIEKVNSLGMKFGLWFEPEMVNEDSDLFRAHPDYAIGAPDGRRCYSRHQFVLDLTRKEVCDCIVDMVNKVLAENNIEYVKWDYNRNVSEFYSYGRESERQMEFAHRYALGFYDICERIVEANPDVFFEGCAGGGERFDPGVLYYFPQIWTSDNSNAEDRTSIQYGTSIVYPLSTMSCHVSDVPNHQTQRCESFETRADIAHLGATGYELDASKFSDEDRARVKAEVDEYRAMQDLVLGGDLYRIDDPMSGNYFTVAVVAKDKSKAVLTSYRRMGGANIPVKRIKMAGLAPEKRYYCPQLDGTYAGSTLMNVGVVPVYPHGDLKTVKFTFEEVN